jgi:hypothetical protein
MSLMELARLADPIKGTLGGVVKLPFDELVRRGRVEQYGELDACSEAFAGSSLPGVEIVRVVGAVEDTALLMELLVDVRTVFWTVEYDLANDVPNAWGVETLDTLRAALAEWQSRDARPQPNPIL